MDYCESRQFKLACKNGKDCLFGGIIVSEEEWANLDDFTLRNEDKSEGVIPFSDLEEGYIIGFSKETETAYRISKICRDKKSVTLDPVENERDKFVIRMAGRSSNKSAVFIRDHSIACNFDNAELTFAAEL